MHHVWGVGEAQAAGGAQGVPGGAAEAGAARARAKRRPGAWCASRSCEGKCRRSQLLDSVEIARLPTPHAISTLSSSCTGLGNFSQTPSRRMRRVGSGRDHLRNPGRLSAMRHRACHGLASCVHHELCVHPWRKQIATRDRACARHPAVSPAASARTSCSQHSALEAGS
jgi:hypothetical protein